MIPPRGAFFTQNLYEEYPNSFFMRPTDHNEIRMIIGNMKSSRTSGADEISVILMAIINVIVEPLAYCVNLSLFYGVVPKLAKTARIIPIYESDKNDNYRPISILPTL